MSVYPTMSTNSLLSTSTIATSLPSDLPNDSSNLLYEDRDHFQAIFSNDSRFFDTSLHLFKSYYSLGYIPADDDKNGGVPMLKSASNGNRHSWRRRLLGSNNNHEHSGGLIKTFLTPTLLRKQDRSNRVPLNSSGIPNEPINNHRQSSMVVQYHRTPTSSMNNVTDDNSDDPDIIITRL